MIDRRRRFWINTSMYRRRYGDVFASGDTAAGATVYKPKDIEPTMPAWPPDVDTAPSEVEPARGGNFGGAGASGSWDAPASTPDFSNVDSGSSSSGDSGSSGGGGAD